MKTLIHSIFFEQFKKFAWLSFLSLLTFGSNLYAQSSFSCGVIQEIQNPENIDLKDPSTYVMDRFGNIHGKESSNTSRSSGCVAGYFEINFLDDFDAQVQQVTCQVFEDLSIQIPQRTQQLSCGEDIPNSNVVINVTGITTAGILGTGSPIYINPPDRICRKIKLSKPYIKINGGRIHQFSNDYDGPDGLMQLNTDANWYFGNGTPPADQLDLYTVVLHEALHILGFAGTSTPGISPTEFMTLWDQQMYVVDSYQSGGNHTDADQVYTSNCQDNCWDLNSNLFTDFDDLAALVGDNCIGTQDIVIGKNGLAPISGGNGVTPSAGNEFNNMISHLNNNCNGQSENYVMAPTLNSGETKRVISNAEFEILCALGYQTQNCDGCYAIAQQKLSIPYIEEDINCCRKDFIFCVGEEYFISEEELLCNDISNDDISISALWGDLNALTITPNNGGWTFSSTIARHYNMRFTIKGCDCKLNTNTFQIVFESCPTTCQVPACTDLICNGDFEAYLPLYGVNLGFPFKYTGGFNNSPDLLEAAGNNYLQIGSFPQSTESQVFELQRSVGPGCELDFSFDASYFFNDGALEVWGSEFPPCDINDVFVEFGCQTTTECADWIYNPICIGSVPITNVGGYLDPQLQPNQLPTWINDNSFPINYIILTPAGESVFLFLDNLSATTSCGNADFNYTMDCSIVDFQSSATGIAHEWDFGDSNTSSDSNPTHIYLTSGTYTVTHTIITECGEFTETKIVEVVVCDCGFELELKSDAESVPCGGGCVTLTAVGADNYSWEPADLVSDPNGAVTQACITETTTFIISAWNDDDECVEKWPITITVDTVNCPGECGVDLVEECLSNGFVKVTVYQDGQEIQMFDADCCVSWTGAPGIPTIGCPQPPGLPALNFNGLTLPLDIGYSVEVVCGECTFEYSGRAGELCGESNGRERGTIADRLGPNELTVFPNPAQQQIGLIYENLRPGDHYQIVNSLGQSFLHEKLESTQMSIPITNLETGLYCLIIFDKNGEVQAQELFAKR